MKKPLVELVGDTDLARAIFPGFCFVLALVCLGVARQTGFGWSSLILPAVLGPLMFVQYYSWQRKGVKKPKITLGPEGFCIGNRAYPFSLNAKGKLKWGKPHLYLWEDIQLITLDDKNPERQVFSWTLRPESPKADAPQHFLFGRRRKQAGKPWTVQGQEALELMVLLKVCEQQEDRRRIIIRFNLWGVPSRSIDELKPDAKKAVRALIDERDQLIKESMDLNIHDETYTGSWDRGKLDRLLETATKAEQILRRQGIDPPRPRLSAGTEIQLGCAALLFLSVVIGLIYAIIKLLFAPL
ncbi:MAG: hypothetical protein CMI31_02715 [Opitutae bacterium]|nr:hypothetical protein [Opitutae bacterium]